MRDAAELARMLAQRTAQLVGELLPHGRREGQEWRCGSLAGEKGQSLAVHLSGVRAGVWSDFSSGERGDALDLVAAVLYGGERRPAMTWARAWLGLSGGQGAPQVQRRPLAATTEADRTAEAEERRSAAGRIWHGCAAGLRKTPVAAYLAARGLELGELGRAPGAIRFHSGLWNAESRRAWPSMVAAISGSDGSALMAIHRTWLAQDDATGRWGKAPLLNPKMTLGSYAGGSIRIARGVSGKPLAKAPEGERVVLAEGIETALSVALSCPELRVLAAVSLANMGRVVLPPTVRHVTLAADNDQGNAAAQRALQAAIERFMAQGRTVSVAMPERPGHDWNDVLTVQAE